MIVLSFPLCLLFFVLVFVFMLLFFFHSIFNVVVFPKAKISGSTDQRKYIYTTYSNYNTADESLEPWEGWIVFSIVSHVQEGGKWRVKILSFFNLVVGKMPVLSIMQGTHAQNSKPVFQYQLPFFQLCCILRFIHSNCISVVQHPSTFRGR